MATGTERLIYFDHNATTRAAPEVVEAMLPYYRELWGNPSSAYWFGHQLARPIDDARARVAELVNAEPREVIFTSCGTESINTAIHSALTSRPEKRHVVTSAVEHSATMKYCAFLEKHGYAVTYLPVDSEGTLDLHEVERAIRPETAIVSVMWANNETGVMFPVGQVAELCRSRGVLCHTDAVQVPGKVTMDVKSLGVDFLSVSAHKLHGPKGIGALYVRRHTKYNPFLFGGGQERGRRGGTENVPAIAGFGRAAELAMSNLEDEQTCVRSMRDRLEEGILARVASSKRNGTREPRLPNTTNIAFDGVEAEGILMLLDQAGICASSGSACTTGSLDPSHVLMAMGCSAGQARGSIRFSLGVENTTEDVDYVLEQVPAIVQKLRELAPV